ncbi:MBL fold metallo-hydrolase [Mycolicibacterium psychrotolerans]|uniref:MBL fold metallo-hydrolase n=1 Tax=Mycolicibacterium psychrotolerans TaxID=216929 RepID=A0A7I7MJ36_9MYCO|nr:MBL fold metallo-hydrolase [Mycolicibacterium psychrotolerans]BBX71842.1 MBL fold metallo-hydrolase [Mycolicibacterium psychrotolerans]
MDISIIETSGLGDRSYLVSHDGTAVVVDPQRDIDRVLGLADDLAVRITHVLETHLHNDYVTGGLELSGIVGAEYVVPGGDDVDYPRRAIADGDWIDAGVFRLQAMHTPGHTHHHMSYALHDSAGTVVGVFTGGSMLHGTTGRTDLLGADHTDDLTRAQYHSVRRLAAELPADAEVYPTHGFGSFCSATPASGDASTIGDERRTNPALTQDEQTYVATLLAGLSAYPAYYAHMGVINAQGPAPVDLSMPEPADPDELRRRIDAGEWVVDLRHRRAFAARHVCGTLGFELSESFVTYLGWLHRWGAPLTLIGESEDQIADARRELVRIGVDRIDGAAIGDPRAWSGSEVRSYGVATFEDLAESLQADEIAILDVRQSGEFADGHLPGALNIPLHELIERIDEVPRAHVWVHCASGYRSSIAASIVDRCGDRAVTLVDDSYENAEKLGLTT